MPFRIVDVDVEEIEAGEPQEVARDNAVRKATAGASAAQSGEVALGVDTLVALVGDGKPATAIEVTRVTFHPLDAATFRWYVASGEWRGRAGGYAIQGRGGALVSRVEGDYLNVVGLPVGALAGLFGGFAAFLAEGN